MGNCQAIDTATIVIQHPCAAKIERLYSPITAAEVMKSNPGHHVALLLTTTHYSSSGAGDGVPLRVTRIKLLRPDDTLVLGHAYRLVTTQEVMKGLWAKKQAKMEQQRHGETRENQAQVKEEKQRCARYNNIVPLNPGSSSKPKVKPKSWQPALKSISEAPSPI